MEKNKELTYKEENKLTKRNYLSIIAPIILSLIFNFKFWSEEEFEFAIM